MTESSLALLFPGQGSQYVGMGKRLAEEFGEAAATFQEADAVLDFELSRLAWGGPEDALVDTGNAQVAILVHSVAAMRVLGDRLGKPAMTAGHSLGEYSAHVAAGTLSFPDALRTVKLRGELMGRSRSGSMVALLGVSDGDVFELCRRASTPPSSVVVPANLNSPGQVVIAGDLDAIKTASRIAPDYGAKRVVPLAVSGAFHSPLMEAAEEGLRAQLEAIELNDPSFPVFANVDAGPVTDAATARDRLIRQLTRPVLWARSVEAMIEAGASRFVELGPGRVLANLNRRNAREFGSSSVGEPEDLTVLGQTHQL